MLLFNEQSGVVWDLARAGPVLTVRVNLVRRRFHHVETSGLDLRPWGCWWDRARWRLPWQRPQRLPES